MLVDPRATGMAATGRLHPGLSFALLELSEEQEQGTAGQDEASTLMLEMGHSTALLESLRHDAGRVKTPRPSSAAAGDRFGRYRLIRRLGQGSQADVWKAIRLDPRPEIVALKRLSPETAREPGRCDQLRREAELGTRLAAPGLLPTLDSGECQGVPYLAMPMVDGTSLREAIALRRRQSTAEAPGGPWWLSFPDDAYLRNVLQALARVCRALHHVHTRRVAHRDIKPANILLDRLHPDRVFLSDFGLACDLDAPPLSARQAGAGTPLFMAPEKLLGGPVDEVGCDLYALGVTLFEAVTLVHPFVIPENIPRACLAAYLLALDPPPPRSIRPGLPEPLNALILRAMDRDPARRPASAAALADDLERFLSPTPPLRRALSETKTVRFDQGKPRVA